MSIEDIHFRHSWDHITKSNDACSRSIYSDQLNAVGVPSHAHVQRAIKAGAVLVRGQLTILSESVQSVRGERNPRERELITAQSYTCHTTATGRARFADIKVHSKDATTTGTTQFDNNPGPHLPRKCYRQSAI